MSALTIAFGSEDSFCKRLELEITKALITLLGAKHLYQSVGIASDILAEYVHSAGQLARWEASRPSLRRTDPQQEEQHSMAVAEAFVSQTIGLPWQPKHLEGAPPSPMHGEPLTLRFELPTIQAYCSACEARGPFNPGSNSAWNSQSPVGITLAALRAQIKAPSRPSTARAILPKPLFEKTPEQVIASILGRSKQAEQMFLFPYQCQQCKGRPIFFLVRRRGLKLTLTGRDPIEGIDLPNFLPKEQRKYFSGAVIAHNAGQTLAGLFLLRTFIEQFWLSLNLPVPPEASTGSSEAFRTTGDDLGSAYSKTLPDDLKSRFPSLTDLYGKLSLAMHTANADVELFEAVQAQIIEHFDARRLFRLDAN